MNKFVFLICPSLFSILILSFLNKERKPCKNDFVLFLVLLGSFCAINNLISFTLIRIIWKVDAVAIIDYVSIKYLFISMMSAIIMPIFLDIIYKYCTVKITIENNEDIR